MDQVNYGKWAKDKVNELLNAQLKIGSDYDEEVIREYLIFRRNTNEGHKILEFFNKYNDDEDLFRTLIKILLDESEDYSNDARYSSAELIPIFKEDILQKYKKNLAYAQQYEIIRLRPFDSDKIPKWLYN